MNTTADVLLRMASERVGNGRDNTGYWLACQLRDNRYSMTDAAEIMQQYASQVPQRPGDQYTEKDALSNLRSAYKSIPREPWTISEADSHHSDRVSAARRRMDVKPLEPPRQIDPNKMRKLQRLLPGVRSLGGTPAQTYLENRGIPLEKALASRVKYHPAWPFLDTEKQWHKLPAAVFPFYNSSGRLVTAQGRVLQPWQGKRHTTFGSVGVGVFTSPDATLCDPLAITEAPVDALSLTVVGCPAIATGGNSNFPDWLEVVIARAPLPGRSRAVLVATDSDEPGEKAAQKIMKRLSLAQSVRLRPSRKDWNEVLTTDGQDVVYAAVIEAFMLTLPESEKKG